MQPGYGTIVGGGDNGCILHYVENNARLKSGDLLLIDAGGEFDGYTADITRTFPVNGKFTPAQEAVYGVVLAAQKAAIREMKPGNSTGRPHEVATRVLTEGMVDLKLLRGDPKKLIAAGKHRQFYMHGTGHWLGMDVHDVGRYKLEEKPRPFEAGMVMTVEPGLYIAPGTKGVPDKYWGIGIRIEDDIVITKDGPEIITGGVPKAPREIEKLMAAA
jgi:Xaa-Pro aminopeptidase